MVSFTVNGCYVSGQPIGQDSGKGKYDEILSVQLLSSVCLLVLSALLV